MHLADTIRGLLRRWYILIPGILLAFGAGAGTWFAIPPSYERSAAMLLLPGEGTLPKESTNPYLFLGGLAQAADVVVKVIVSQENLSDLQEAHPSLEVQAMRDPTTAGPVIVLNVSAATDQETEDVLRELVSRTTRILERLQAEQNVTPQNRIVMTVLAIDETGAVQQRTRLVVTIGVVGSFMLMTLLLASGVDGFARRPRERPSSGEKVELSDGQELLESRPATEQSASVNELKDAQGNAAVSAAAVPRRSKTTR